jgi:hypothetical protein
MRPLQRKIVIGMLCRSRTSFNAELIIKGDHQCLRRQLAEISRPRTMVTLLRRNTSRKTNGSSVNRNAGNASFSIAESPPIRPSRCHHPLRRKRLHTALDTSAYTPTIFSAVSAWSYLAIAARPGNSLLRDQTRTSRPFRASRRNTL